MCHATSLSQLGCTSHPARTLRASVLSSFRALAIERDSSLSLDQLSHTKMAGFLLGTGSGLLAGAAVYYTLSTDLEKNTLNLRNE